MLDLSSLVVIRNLSFSLSLSLGGETRISGSFISASLLIPYPVFPRASIRTGILEMSQSSTIITDQVRSVNSSRGTKSSLWRPRTNIFWGPFSLNRTSTSGVAQTSIRTLSTFSLFGSFSVVIGLSFSTSFTFSVAVLVIFLVIGP